MQPVVNVIYFSFFFLSTIASITATAVMFTISRTEASQSVKWIGLFNPICIGHLDDNNSRIMADIMMTEAKEQGAGVIVTSIGKHMDLPYEHVFKL